MKQKKINTQFAFGYGLSYTGFEDSNFKIDRNNIGNTETATVSGDIKNVE